MQPGFFGAPSILARSHELFSFHSLTYMIKCCDQSVFPLLTVGACCLLLSRVMLESLQKIVSDLVHDFRGESSMIPTSDGTFISAFRDASVAVSFALKLRRVIGDALWPEEVLALPGCGIIPLQLPFQRSRGPRMKTVIDWVTTPSPSCFTFA